MFKNNKRQTQLNKVKLRYFQIFKVHSSRLTLRLSKQHTIHKPKIKTTVTERQWIRKKPKLEPLVNCNEHNKVVIVLLCHYG